MDVNGRLKTYTLSMEDKMAAGAFGCARKYGWDSSLSFALFLFVQNNQWNFGCNVHFNFCLNFLFVQERERLKEEKKQEKKLLKERKMVRTLESAKDLFRDHE